MKLKYNIFLIFIILVVICSITSVVAVDDGNVTLQNDDSAFIATQDDDIINEVECDVQSVSESEEDVLSESTKSFTDLRNDLEFPIGNNITLSGTYKYEPVGDKGSDIGVDFDLKRNFTIIGENLIIDGSHCSRAFTIRSNLDYTTEFINITFINCHVYQTGDGGAVFSSSPVKFKNCVFENCSAGGRGGAVAVFLHYSSDFKSGLENCRFINNKADSNCSAVFWDSTYMGNQRHTDIFSNNYFINHSGNAQNVFYYEGNNSSLGGMHFINNTNKICLDVLGNGNGVSGSDSYNNTGISVRVIGNNTMFGGNKYNNTGLDNDDYAMVIIGNNSHIPGVNIISKKAIQVIADSTKFYSCNFDGEVSLKGDAILYGISFNSDLTLDGSADLRGTSVNGDLTLNSNSQIWGGSYKNIYNNGVELNLTKVSLDNSELINNNGVVNLDNCSLNNSVLTNNKGVLNVDNSSLSNSVLTNNKGTVNLNNATCKDMTITNYDKLNINKGTSFNGTTLSNSGTISVSDDTNMSGIDVKKVDLKASVNSVSMYYGATKYLKIKVADPKGNPVSGFKLTITINKKKYYATTNANGIATLKVPGLTVGTYVVKITGANDYSNPINIQTKVKVNKAKTTVKAPKVTAKFKKSKYFKITIKSKVTKKVLKKVKIKVKVYTGKKYKVYKIKTNKKGVAKINTKKLKKGKHKVVISSLNKNYKISKKSQIKIK